MSMRSALTGMACALVACPLANPAAAQDTGTLEEVFVTAQKRQQSIQDVPAAVTAIGGAQLEALGATGNLDYLFRTPSVSFEVTGTEGRSNRDISIRGVNTTGYYFGETALPAGVNPRLTDVTRIEVLRGPQGTLYGSSSMGGLVKVVPTAPSTSKTGWNLEASLGATEGADTPDHSLEGVFNAALVPDALGLRVVAYYSREPGFIDSIFGQPLDYAPEIPTDSLPKGVRRGVNDGETYGGRAALLWLPAENLSVTTTVLWQKLMEDDSTDSDFSAASRGTRYRSYDIPEPFYERDVVGQLEVQYELGDLTLTSSTALVQSRIWRAGGQYRVHRRNLPRRLRRSARATFSDAHNQRPRPDQQTAGTARALRAWQLHRPARPVLPGKRAAAHRKPEPAGMVHRPALRRPGRRRPSLLLG